MAWPHVHVSGYEYARRYRYISIYMHSMGKWHGRIICICACMCKQVQVQVQVGTGAYTHTYTAWANGMGACVARCQPMCSPEEMVQMARGYRRILPGASETIVSPATSPASQKKGGVAQI